jgi:hypothetical protein
VLYEILPPLLQVHQPDRMLDDKVSQMAIHRAEDHLLKRQSDGVPFSQYIAGGVS